MNQLLDGNCHVSIMKRINKVSEHLFSLNYRYMKHWFVTSHSKRTELSGWRLKSHLLNVTPGQKHVGLEDGWLILFPSLTAATQAWDCEQWPGGPGYGPLLGCGCIIWGWETDTVLKCHVFKAVQHTERWENINKILFINMVCQEMVIFKGWMEI